MVDLTVFKKVGSKLFTAVSIYGRIKFASRWQIRGLSTRVLIKLADALIKTAAPMAVDVALVKLDVLDATAIHHTVQSVLCIPGSGPTLSADSRMQISCQKMSPSEEDSWNSRL